MNWLGAVRTSAGVRTSGGAADAASGERLASAVSVATTHSRQAWRLRSLLNRLSETDMRILLQYLGHGLRRGARSDRIHGQLCREISGVAGSRHDGQSLVNQQRPDGVDGCAR